MANQQKTHYYCRTCFGNEISAFLRPRLTREDFYHLKMLTVAFGVPLSVTKIEHNCVLSPNQHFATIQKLPAKMPQPVASTSRAPLAHSTMPMAKSLPKQQQQPPASTSRAPLAHSTLPMAKSPPEQQQQQPPAPKMGKVSLKVIHENGDERNMAISMPVGDHMPVLDILMRLASRAFPFTPQMPFKCYKEPPGSDLDYVILIGNIELVKHSQMGKEEAKIEPVGQMYVKK